VGLQVIGSGHLALALPTQGQLALWLTGPCAGLTEPTRRMGGLTLARDRLECHVAQGLDTATLTLSWVWTHPRPNPSWAWTRQTPSWVWTHPRRTWSWGWTCPRRPLCWVWTHPRPTRCVNIIIMCVINIIFSFII